MAQVPPLEKTLANTQRLGVSEQSEVFVTLRVRAHRIRTLLRSVPIAFGPVVGGRFNFSYICANASRINKFLLL
jgi:hypothetical protein